MFCRLLLLLSVLCAVVWCEEKTIDQQIIDAVTDVTEVDLLHGNYTMVVELDMIMSYADWLARRTGRRGYGAIRTGLWKDGVVPYEEPPDKSFNAREKQLIYDAFAEYHKYTCLRFRRARKDEERKVYFYAGRGCSSAVGDIGYRQPISLAAGCRHHGVIVHELGHAVGLNHEQSRPDRDNYVTIVESNIDDDMEYNFDKYDRDYIDSRGLEYDYLSIMHYGKTAFAIDTSRPTIRTHDDKYQHKIGQRNGLSFGDIQVLNLMYNCAAHCDTQCPAGSYVGKDCKCYCQQPRKGRKGAPVAECGKENKGGEDGEDDCVNKKYSCERWAASRTCEIDPAYMKKWCPKACGFCGEQGGNGGGATTGGGQQETCENKKLRCQEYAAEGTCQTDRNYMMRFCQKACGFCQEINGEACIDENERCDEYKRWGTCKSDPGYMNKHCRKVCGFCGKDGESSSQDCLDLKPSCSVWAKGTGCDRDPAYMVVNCKKSCNWCALGTPPKPTCEDISHNCSNLEKNSGCAKNPHFMHQFCRKTCKACGGDRAAFITGSCKDANEYCAIWADRGMCKDVKDYMKLNCTKSCGFCSSQVYG